MLDRISTHNNPQPLCICLCYTSLRTGNRPNNCTSSEIKDGHTLFGNVRKRAGVFRSTFLVNERVLEPSPRKLSKAYEQFSYSGRKKGSGIPHS